MPSDLIARLAAATEPSRELDAEIVTLITPECIGVERGPFGGPSARKTDEWLYIFEPHRTWSDSWLPTPRYTASLDAAMTLVPEGWDWSLNSDGSCEIYKDVPPGMLPGAPGSTLLIGEAATRLPALALTIAAIRARGVG